MKKTILGWIAGVLAAILWSLVFVIPLNTFAGILITLCLGIGFGISFNLIFSKDEKSKQ
jgi:hypothetical protein